MENTNLRPFTGELDPEPAPNALRPFTGELDGETSPKQDSNIARGFKTAMRQVPQTFGGAAALVGDAVGSKGLNEWGMDVYQSQEKKIQELSRDNDSFTKAISGDGNLADWAGYGAGYVGGQALQAAATGGAGAFIGKKVAEIAAKKAIQSGVERGIAKEVAEKAASEMVSKGIKRGASTGAYTSNLMQEAGSIYPEALGTAKEEGRLQEDGGLSGADLVRAGGAAAGAAALDTLMEAKMLKGVLGGGSATDANMLKRIAKEAGKGAGREALTEGAQTGIERWGAQQSLGDKEAVTDYIDSAAMGALGGAMGGAGAGVRSPNSGENPASSSAINNEAATQAAPGQPLQLGNIPDPLIQFRDGTVARQSEIDAHLASLPESERQTFVAQILGYAPQQADEPQLTTSPGATQFDGAATEQPSASVAAPDFGTSLGAQPEQQGGGLEFQHQIDTSGLSLERLDSPFTKSAPATVLDRQALARQGAYPTSPTPAPK